jgi:hypothetical protein
MRSCTATALLATGAMRLIFYGANARRSIWVPAKQTVVTVS